MTSDLIARLETIPFSRWHLRARLIVGSATFFDAFDALSLAFVLPVLVPRSRGDRAVAMCRWQLTEHHDTGRMAQTVDFIASIS